MTTKDKMVDRVRKLLSLANSANEHEAAAAAAQAADLMVQFEIEAAMLEGRQDVNLRAFLGQPGVG